VIRTPDLFIVGAPKSGTTSLYEYLKGHPDIYMSKVKEPCYFPRDFALDDSGNFLVYGRDEKSYYALFDNAGDAKRAGEGSTRYLYSLDAPALIREAQPGAFVLVMLRNPVDMIQSLHAHKLAAGTEDEPNFERALALETDRRAGRKLPRHSNPKLSTYRERAMFADQLQRWFDAVGRERVHVGILEDMIGDPSVEFRKVLEFLQVDPNWQPESFAAHNTAHAPRSVFVRRVLNGRIPQWFVWQAMPRIIGDKRTRELVRAFQHSSFHRRPLRKATMRPELRRRLEDEFMPDVVHVSQMLGRDLGQLWFQRPALAAPATVRPKKETVAAS